MIEGKNSITMSSSNCLTCHSQKAFIKALKKQLGEQEKKMSQLIDIAKRAINAKKLLEEQVKTLQQQNGGVSTKKTRRKVSKEERMENLLNEYHILKSLHSNDNNFKGNCEKSSEDDKQLLIDYKVADSSKRSTCLLQFVYGIGERLAIKSPEEFSNLCEKIVIENGTEKDAENFDKKLTARSRDLRDYLSFYKILNYFDEVGKWKDMKIFLQIEFHVSYLFKLLSVGKKEKEYSKVLKRTIDGNKGTESKKAKKISPLERALAKLVEEETKKDEA